MRKGPCNTLCEKGCRLGRQALLVHKHSTFSIYTILYPTVTRRPIFNLKYLLCFENVKVRRRQSCEGKSLRDALSCISLQNCIGEIVSFILVEILRSHQALQARHQPRFHTEVTAPILHGLCESIPIAPSFAFTNQNVTEKNYDTLRLQACAHIARKLSRTW